jgi:hypothetical protein
MNIAHRTQKGDYALEGLRVDWPRSQQMDSQQRSGCISGYAANLVRNGLIGDDYIAAPSILL